MADISQIKTPNGTTYDIKDAKKKGVYVVKGTHTTATVAWTGAIDVPALYDGLTIAYYLPISATSGSTQVTLNLTLSGGDTTGAVKCFYNASKLTRSYYSAGSSILMTYWSAGSISISGTATTEARWIASADYNANTWRNITVDGTQVYSTSASSGALSLLSGNNISITGDGSAPANITISSNPVIETLFITTTIATTQTQYNTYLSRKFSDYDFILFKIGAGIYDVRRTVLLTRADWISGTTINEVMIHGSTASTASSYTVSSMALSYNSDTSFKGTAGAAGVLNYLTIHGICRKA